MGTEGWNGRNGQRRSGAGVKVKFARVDHISIASLFGSGLWRFLVDIKD